VQRWYMGSNLNGREIANATNTALTLARSQEEKLQLRHITTVLDAKRDFEQVMNRLSQPAYLLRTPAPAIKGLLDVFVSILGGVWAIISARDCSINK
jgi:hypothetical protein